MRNYYDILGISRDATPEQIKLAYRKLAKKYHPDASDNQEAKERFQEIQEAYSVLSDPEKRKTYHYYGHSAYRSTYFTHHSTGSAHHEHVHDHSCGGCGGNCDGNCGSCSHKHPPRDPNAGKHVVRIAVWLEMEETFREVIKDVIFKEHITRPRSASGPRHLEKEWKFQIKLPANTYVNQFFPLEDIIWNNDELMHYLHTEYPDNYYVVKLLLRDKPGYTRQDYHLYLDYTIDFHTLVLGGTVRVPTFSGDLLLKIPPGTSPEQRLRLPGHGLNYPKKIGNRGDLYLNLHVRIPKTLTPAQLNAFQALREAMENPEAAE